MPALRESCAPALLVAVLLTAAWIPAPAGAHGGQDTFFGHEAVYAVAWNSQGTQFATGTQPGNISIYDGVTHTLRVQWQAHAGPINQVAFSPDGSEIVSSSGGYLNATAEATIKVWTLQALGLPTLRLNLSGHHDWIPTVVWSPDGRLLASASGIDDHVDPDNAFGEVFLWDAVGGGPPLWKFTDLDSYPSRLAWSPDGREIAAIGHLSDIWLLNATTHEQIRVSVSFRDAFGHASHGWAVDWSPDSRYIVAGFSRDFDEDGSTDRGPVVVFDTLDLNPDGLARLVMDAYVHTKPTQWVAWDSTGGYIASCTGADVLDGDQPGQDGVVDVGEVVIYNYSGSSTGTLEGMHIFRGGFSFCSSVAWRPGDLAVLAGNADGTARLYALDADGDGCFVWDDAAPLDASLCALPQQAPVEWWPDGTTSGLLVGGLALVAVGAILMVRGRRARAQEEAEREARSRRGARRSGGRSDGSKGEPPARGQRRRRARR